MKVVRFGAVMAAQAPAHKLSTLQDLERGRRLEIEETLGYAVRKGLELAVPLPTATPEPRRTLGEVKIEVCRLLGQDWEELADYVGIQPHEKARFARGNEPRGVWEWLAAIGRDDL